MTFELFKRNFLELTGGEKMSYKGFLQWPIMLQPRKDKSLMAYFTGQAKAHSDWTNTLPALEDPHDYLSAESLAMEEILNLSPAALRSLRNDFCMQDRMTTCEHVAMGMFYHGLSIPARDELRVKEANCVWDMRQVIADFEDNKLSNGHAVHAIAENDHSENSGESEHSVDAMRYKKPASTGPKPPSKPRSTITCWYCKKQGHSQTVCNKRAKDGAPPAKPPPGFVRPGKKLNAVEETTVSKPHLNY